MGVARNVFTGGTRADHEHILSARIKAGSQYDAGPCVMSIYVFLRNASDAEIEFESIQALSCVLNATLEKTLVPFQLHLRCVRYATLVMLGPASSSVIIIVNQP